MGTMAAWYECDLEGVEGMGELRRDFEYSEKLGGERCEDGGDCTFVVGLAILLKERD